ncbi:MAG: RecX family transcriptional regulator [bacterium]|nr:RecX family transcriptional regulator [bacterium]
MPTIINTLHRRRGTWVELFLDAGESIRLPIEQASGLSIGTLLDEERWAQLRRESDYYLLLDKALRLLGMREHFALELRRKLALRSLDRALVGRVLDTCRECGYLDDARAAEYVTTQALLRGGIGRLKLRATLKERGCPDDLLEQSLARFAELCDEAEVIRVLLAARHKAFEHKRDQIREQLEKREGIGPRKVRFVLRTKLGAVIGGYLYARGFSGEDVNRAGRKLVDELLEGLDSDAD